MIWPDIVEFRGAKLINSSIFLSLNEVLIIPI